MIVAASIERGLEHIEAHSKPTNHQQMLKFIQGIDTRYGKRVAVFWDCDSWHRGQLIEDSLKVRGIEKIENLRYRPDRQAVELVNSMLKAAFRQIRLEKLV